MKSLVDENDLDVCVASMGRKGLRLSSLQSLGGWRHSSNQPSDLLSLSPLASGMSPPTE